MQDQEEKFREQLRDAAYALRFMGVSVKDIILEVIGGADRLEAEREYAEEMARQDYQNWLEGQIHDH